MRQITDFERMKKIANILEKVFFVLIIGGIILATLLTVADAFVAFISTESLVVNWREFGFLENLVIEFSQVDMNMAFVKDTISFKPIMLALLSLMIVYIVFYVINFWYLRKILRSVGTDQPFNVKNADYLSIMGFLFIVGGFVLELLGSFVFAKILENVIRDIGMQYSISLNFNMLFTGILLLILSGVFRYGVYLQNEYDETV